MSETLRRLSVRRLAMQSGIPASAIVRAIERGELAAAITTTPTGQSRAYIHPDAAQEWLDSIVTKPEPINMTTQRATA